MLFGLPEVSPFPSPLFPVAHSWVLSSLVLRLSTHTPSPLCHWDLRGPLTPTLKHPPLQAPLPLLLSRSERSACPVLASPACLHRPASLQLTLAAFTHLCDASGSPGLVPTLSILDTGSPPPSPGPTALPSPHHDHPVLLRVDLASGHPLHSPGG